VDNNLVDSQAIAYVRGDSAATCLFGEIRFYQKPEGVLVVANISGLPENNADGFFALHIHDGDSCQGTGFPASGSHYDSQQKPHPRHAGDLPPLLSSGGMAYMAVLTDRFTIDDIAGKTIIIHDSPDDFHSQPAGNAGEKLACGVIRRC